MKRVVKKITTHSTLVSFLIIGICIFLACFALLHKGFFRTVDDTTTVRIMYIEKELQRGEGLNNFPVHMSAELANGHGYPIYLFYAPFVYYIGAIFMMVLPMMPHVNIWATKFIYIFPLIVGPLLFYWTARYKMNRFIATISTILYTFFPYRGFDIYLKGGSGESWAIAFIPGVFAGLFLLEKKKKIGGPIFAIFLALVIFSHQLVGYLTIILVILYAVFFFLRRIDFWFYLTLAAGLTTFYWLPLLAYLKLVRITELSDNTTGILQSLLTFSTITTVQMASEPDRRFTSDLVLYTLLVGIFGAAYMFYRKKITHKKEILFWGLSALFFYFFLTAQSFFIWKMILPLVGVLQFAWRLLSILAFIIPFFLGLWLMTIQQRNIQIFITVIFVGCYLTFLPFFKPTDYSYYVDYGPEGSCHTTTWENEYLPSIVKKCAPSNEPTFILQKKGTIHFLTDNIIDATADITSPTSNELIVTKYYFPGWTILTDGKIAPVDYHFSQYGFFETPLSKGTHSVRAFYTQTALMWFADIVSLISLLLTIYLCYATIQKNKTVKKARKYVK